MNEDEFREIMVDFDELILNDLTNNQVRDLYAVANNVFLDAQQEGYVVMAIEESEELT